MLSPFVFRGSEDIVKMNILSLQATDLIAEKTGYCFVFGTNAVKIYLFFDKIPAYVNNIYNNKPLTAGPADGCQVCRQSDSDI